ncbi:MAG: mechanosensitive ion channel family protein [Actinomycetes bacterium]
MTAREIADDVVTRAAELGTRLVVFVLLAGAVVIVGRLLRPLVRSRLDERGRPSFTRVFSGLYTAVVTVVGVLLAATLAFPSVRMVDVLASLGIVSVAVGFAFKDVLENLLAGVLLLLRDPFKSGDEIRVGEFEGTVEGVTVRETLLRTHDGQRVLLPNADVYTSALEVLTHRPHARVDFPVVLDAEADVDLARRTATGAMRELPGVLAEPGPDAVVTGVAPGELTLQCRLWTAADRASRARAADAAVPAVIVALRSAGVPLATGDVVVRRADGATPDNRRVE